MTDHADAPRVALSGRALAADADAWAAPAEGFAFWWLGQAGFILKFARTVLYVDPYLAPSERRLVPPLLAPEEVTNADLVLCTHEHTDHLDPTALRGIAQASPGAAFVVPRPLVPKAVSLGAPADRVVGMNAGEWINVGDVVVSAVPAQHEFFDAASGAHRYLGYVIRSGAACAYHAGDTLRYDGLLPLLRGFAPQVVFLPINGRDGARYRRGTIGNMTWQEAVDLAGESGARLAVPMHFGMFASNTADPALFADYLAAKFPSVRCCIPAPGERTDVGRL